MNLLIQKSYLVEVNLTTVTANQRYTFLDVPQLSQRSGNTFVQGIEAFDSTGLSVSSTGKNVIGTTAAAAPANVLCTFVVGDKEDIFQMPYYSMIGRVNAGVIKLFMNKRINLTKSYITLTSATGITATESCVFNFLYK